MVEVESIIVEPLASAEAVLEEEEMKQGVVVADIGGGTTGLAVYLEGSVFHTSVLPVGGNHLTRDLVVGLRCPYQVAEEAKERYGHAIPSLVDADESVELDCFGSERRKSVPRRRLCEILQARCEEIIEMVVSEAKRSVHDDILSAGLVLTGGAANLPGPAPSAPPRILSAIIRLTALQPPPPTPTTLMGGRLSRSSLAVTIASFQQIHIVYQRFHPVSLPIQA